MVFRRRMSQSLRPVHRIKHVIDLQTAGVAGTQVLAGLASSVDAPTLAATTEVETGSSINGIFLKVEVIALTSAALPNFYLMVFKNPGNNLTFPNANVVGSNDNKKFVIHQEMVMLQRQDGSNPRTVFAGVIVIPKGYRRMAINDQLSLALFSPGINFEACFQCHYKEFR